jgi:hypothetical protein
MQAVITKAQARQITRGREPHVPVEYEQAVTALQACLTLDESKYWSDRADALAAWAKIYGNDQAGRKAKMLKLHAYRRMGILAAELCPPGSRKMGVGNGKGSLPGPRALLESHGLSTAAADAARTLANLPKREFVSLLSRPISPTTARHYVRDITIWHEVQRALMSLRSVTRRHTPAQVVATLSLIEKQNGRALAGEISEWLDEFDARAGR